MNKGQFSGMKGDIKPSLGINGAVLTGNITLQGGSPASMVVTPATPGLYATLPNATSLVKGMNQFAIYNAGEYDYGVKDSAGTVLGWIRPQVGGVFGLADNTSAAGIWNLTNVEKVGATALYRSESGTTATNPVVQRPITIDSTRELFIFGSATTIYGIVFDSSSNSWGTPVLIRAVAVTTSSAILSAANQVLVISCDATTGYQGVTLTLSGTSITVNTAASVALSSNIIAFGNLVALGTSWVHGYATTTVAIRAFSISGTTVTIGSESAQTPAAGIPSVLLVTGSNLRVVSTSNATLIYCKPYTVSGVTLTAGTEASSGCDTSAFRAFVNGNSNVVVETFNISHRAIIFKLTGTVEAASAVTLDAGASGAITNTGYTVISASKTLFTQMIGGTAYFNILTDTAGTASVGTAVTHVMGVTLVNPMCSSSVVSNVARVTGCSNTVLGSYNIDCSGTSAVINSTKRIGGIVNFLITAQDKYGVIDGRSLSLTSADYSLGSAGYSAAKVTANSIAVYLNAPSIRGTYIKGKSDSISWDANTSSTTTGIYLQRIEAAA